MLYCYTKYESAKGLALVIWWDPISMIFPEVQGCNWDSKLHLMSNPRKPSNWKVFWSSDLPWNLCSSWWQLTIPDHIYYKAIQAKWQLIMEVLSITWSIYIEAPIQSWFRNGHLTEQTNFRLRPNIWDTPTFFFLRRSDHAHFLSAKCKPFVTHVGIIFSYYTTKMLVFGLWHARSIFTLCRQCMAQIIWW